MKNEEDIYYWEEMHFHVDRLTKKFATKYQVHPRQNFYFFGSNMSM